MNAARQEKPSVPTPDAGEVWAHHRDSALAKLSIPERAALTRRLAELEAGPLVAEVERLREEVDMLGNGLADMNEALLASEYCGDPSMRDSDERVEVTTDPNSPERKADYLANDDPRKQRMRDEQDALLADMQAARTPSPAAGAVALPDGWRWWDPMNDFGCMRLLRGPHTENDVAGRAWVSGRWMVSGDHDEQQTCPPTLAAAQQALLAELRKRGTLPAAAASADGRMFDSFGKCMAHRAQYCPTCQRAVIKAATTALSEIAERLVGAWMKLDASESALVAERAARVAAEGALAALRERIEAAASSYTASMLRERAYCREQQTIGRNDLATSAANRGDSDAAAAHTLRKLLDSPDAGAKGEVRCSRCHGDGYPECARKVDE